MQSTVLDKLKQQAPDLVEEWEYEFKVWTCVSGFEPIKLIYSFDYSQPYEMDRGHLFLNINGSYALVLEQGCSCYDPSWATIDIYPDYPSAVKAFNEVSRSL